MKTATQNRRILLIDDNPAIHDDFRKILAPAATDQNEYLDEKALLFGTRTVEIVRPEFEIDSAFQGQEGFDLVERSMKEGQPYALAFVDVRMPPGWDGVETIERIWKSDPDLQVVICTAYSDHSWDEMMRRLGQSDNLLILKKPFDNVEVLQLANALTKKWNVTREASARINCLDQLVRVRTGELQVVFDLMPAMIWFKDTNDRILRVNQRVADTAGKSIDEIEGKPSSDNYPQEAARHYQDDLEVIRSGEPKMGIVDTLRNRHGESIWIETDKVPYRDQDGKVIGIVVMAQDITERKQAEAELEKSHREFAEASRRAGMAEMATGVLHNVGNVLNSVNVASSCMAERLQKSKAVHLSKVVTMLREHEGDLATFLTQDTKGKHLPAYLSRLAEHLAGEHAIVLKELAELQKNIQHIKAVVTVQQSGAKDAGKLETIQVTDLVEDTLRMDSGGSASSDIQVVREFEHAPLIAVEKHKVLQILMNLVRNAKQSCQERGALEKRLTLRVTNGDNRVRIAVHDNGVGISSENLARIFAHGFTTKKNGHGFGLHSAIAAAKEMGGELRVQSDGIGQGATFTLELPLSPLNP